MRVFAESLLPQRGMICVGELATSFFRNHWLDTPAAAVQRAYELDQAGHTVFIAQGGYAQGGTLWKGRGGNNVVSMRNFFLDIDCGEGKPYATQRDGLTALFSFCKKASLPGPSVVNSGNGLYAHWILDQDVPVAIWKAVATLLQKLVKKYEPGLDIDGICADRARVLRPVGTTNRKHGEKPVQLVRQAPPVRTVGFCTLIKTAAAEVKIPLNAPKSTLVTNAEFLAGFTTTRPSSAERIAGKCAQIGLIRSSLGAVPEPLWYAAIGLLRFTVEAPGIVHTWSQGYEGYSVEETDKKRQQHEQYGPTTCAKFDQVSKGVCPGCRYAEKTVSPITLGYEAPQPLTVAETEDALPEPPSGFLVTTQGVFYDDGGEPREIYPYPLWVVSVNTDFFGESFTLRHRLPHDGWREVTVASNKICEPRTFFATMFDASIGVVGKDNRGLFMVFIETFMAKLRAQQKLSRLSGQMGWCPDGDKLAFVHGASIYRADGSVQKGGYSASAPDFVRSMTPVGDKTEWIANTAVLNRPGMEGLAFQFLAGAFGAPLVRFTGFEGVCLSAIGESGVGKTLVGKWGLSAWGDPRRLMLMRDDTRNMLVSRLGVYNTLPAYIDEVTNIEAKELSDIVYKITQGREKGRLDKNAVERKNINPWNTLAVVSSNASLADKLAAFKGDANAELNRLFEFEILSGFSMEEGRTISATIDGNYGEVGQIYARHLVINQDKHRDALTAIARLLAAKIKAKPDERFWLMCGAVALYGGMIAKKLGVSLVDVARLERWVCGTIMSMRQYKSLEGFDAISFLGAFLDRYAGAGLVVSDFKATTQFAQRGYREPHHNLVYRIELDRKRLWISYDVIKKELMKIHMSSRRVAAELTAKGVLKTGGRMNLGRGTNYQGFGQYVWELDLTKPELGYVMMAIVDTKPETAKEVGV